MLFCAHKYVIIIIIIIIIIDTNLESQPLQVKKNLQTCFVSIFSVRYCHLKTIWYIVSNDLS